ncbi:MAG: hypothetical protein OEZ13_01400 [Spirochaetia bacterium]|nr:hypothetical protein [Spirochaetia bacterium]
MKEKLGELLRHENAITEKELKEALKRQESSGDKLGKILIELGYITHIELIKYLSKNQIKPAIGEILLAIGFITQNQLNEALNIQNQNKEKKIGNILVEKNYISKELLIQILTVQSKAIFNGQNVDESNQYSIKGRISAEILRRERHLNERYEVLKEEEKLKALTKKEVPPQNGFATITGKNQDKYIGELKDGLMHGKGIYTDLKNRYVGDFIKGKFHGEGTLTSLDGLVIHSGFWKNGKPA